MNLEDALQAAIDADPMDFFLREVLADHLDDNGDPRAAGYRALAANCRWPDLQDDGKWVWYGIDNPHWRSRPYALTLTWRTMLREPWGSGSRHPSRRLADDAAAIAFSRLSEEEQAALLQLLTVSA